MAGVLFRVGGIANLKYYTERQEIRKVGALDIVEVFEQHESEPTGQGRAGFRVKGKQNDAPKTEPHP